MHENVIFIFFKFKKFKNLNPFILYNKISIIQINKNIKIDLKLKLKLK
jgi:hypothetical protein